MGVCVWEATCVYQCVGAQGVYVLHFHVCMPTYVLMCVSKCACLCAIELVSWCVLRVSTQMACLFVCVCVRARACGPTCTYLCAGTVCLYLMGMRVCMRHMGVCVWPSVRFCVSGMFCTSMCCVSVCIFHVHICVCSWQVCMSVYWRPNILGVCFLGVSLAMRGLVCVWAVNVHACVRGPCVCCMVFVFPSARERVCAGE